MNASDYLDSILLGQTLADDGPELRELRRRRKEIERLLRAHFTDSTPSIRWGGSMAKGTMIREAYDGDMTCYFPRDDSGAGDSLEVIYENVAKTLSQNYEVERKTSALRVKDSSTKAAKGFAADLHIDVVPGRFTSDDENEVFLHQNAGNKERLKTNLQVHIDHIKGSGVTPAIRLMKLWNVRNGISAKTFVLELLVVRLLAERKSSGLASQLQHVWTEFRDKPDDLAVEDPANPTGNDLKPVLDRVRYRLSSVAATTLDSIERQGWEAVFGSAEEEGPDAKRYSLKTAAARATNPTRPWLRGT